MKVMPRYWVAKYDADVLGHILGSMTNEVNMDGSPSEAMLGYWVAKTNMLSHLMF